MISIPITLKNGNIKKVHINVDYIQYVEEFKDVYIIHIRDASDLTIRKEECEIDLIALIKREKRAK